MNAPVPVIVHGAEGRMGRLVTELVEEADGFDLVGLVTEPGRERPAGSFHDRLPLVGQEALAGIDAPGAVIVDFSLAPALDGLLEQAGVAGCPLVSGTTGFDAGQWERLREFGARHPVVHATNFSIGIPALQMLLQLLARTLPDGFDPEQVECHHRTKVDRPSGTALTLARAWEEIRGGPAVPTHSLRQGAVVGEHTWTFSDECETLVLTHRAQSRQAFLRGVLPAARFAVRSEPGVYTLTDVLKGIVTD